jgi:DNA-binding HxlR family transcriptional regulator
MLGYKHQQYCPVAAATEVLGDPWTPLIVRELLAGTTHFNAFLRTLPGISRAVLVQRLRHLERLGVVEHRCAPRGQPSAYRLTAAGEALRPVVEMLGAWGARWGMSEGAAAELDVDPGVILCRLRLRIVRAALPPQRVVVQVEVRGPPAGTYWYVLAPSEASLCFQYPGFDIDLVLTADVGTLYDVWLGRTTLGDALRAGMLGLDGTPALTRAFPHWFR